MLGGKGPRRPPQKRLDGRLEEVAKAAGGGYCRLQMPLKLALAVRGTVAGHRLGALEEGGGGTPPLPMQRWAEGFALSCPGPPQTTPQERVGRLATRVTRDQRGLERTDWDAGRGSFLLSFGFAAETTGWHAMPC